MTTSVQGAAGGGAGATSGLGAIGHGLEGGDALDAVGSLAATRVFDIALPDFEGPLDLLLHLIREHKLDILDIPISLITERYLEVLRAMEALDIDVAAEFLVMAATLVHIKSRLLLPREAKPSQPTPEEEGEDPRAALVRRLLEYQKYKEAGESLGARPILGRDSFARDPAPEDAAEIEGESLGFSEVSAFKLIEAFDGVMKRAKIRVPFEVSIDRLSLSEVIDEVIGRIGNSGPLTFRQLVDAGRGGPALLDGSDAPPDRHRVVIVFLALLEMVRLRVLRILAPSDGGEIVVDLREGVAPTAAGGAPTDDYRS